MTAAGSRRSRTAHRVQVTFDQLVRGATRIRSCQVLIVPGLLQTRDYALAQLLAAYRLNAMDTSGIEDVADARMRRQDVLYNQTKTFELYFTAAALAYYPCPAPVMAGQLDRLLTASHMPNVTVGIVPPHAQLTVIPATALIVADDVAVIERPEGDQALRGDDAAFYHRYADGLAAEAVTGDAARALITAAAAQLPR